MTSFKVNALAMHINTVEGGRPSTLIQLGAWVYSPGCLQDQDTLIEQSETEITMVNRIIKV